MEMIEVYIMGRTYQVPRGLTILKALEYSGYRLTRGCGCRGGVCGACLTVFRKRGDYRLRTGLACQTQAEDGMALIQLPFTPANRAMYSVRNIKAEEFSIAELYPELMRCVGCNTCTKACPMDLQVMDYVAAAKRGDWEKVTDLSMECVMCGMCAARCPAELSQFNIALLIRRVYGKSKEVPQHLQDRLEAIESGQYDEGLVQLKALSPERMHQRFQEYQKDRGEAV